MNTNNIGMHEIFTIPVFSTKTSLDNKKILEFCLEQERSSPGRIVTNSGGWQSNEIKNPPPELKDLFDLIIDSSKHVCNFLQINHLQKIDSAWININRYRDFNWTHSHPFGMLSGVYYVKTPQYCGDIVFENLHFESVYLSIQQQNKYNSKACLMPSEEGVLYIFPSWLFHKVIPNMNMDEERVSISFNIQ